MKTRGVIFSILGFLAVALGAFAAHGLKGRLSPDHMDVFRTGVSYHFYHALALGLTLALPGAPSSDSLRRAGNLFIAGIVLFSGSLYALALTGVGKFGAITPLGGVSFLAGWAYLARHFLKSETS